MKTVFRRRFGIKENYVSNLHNVFRSLRILQQTTEKMTKTAVILLLSALVGVVFSRSTPMEDHIHCARTTCPLYELRAKYGDLELRCYEPSIWVSVSGSGE